MAEFSSANEDEWQSRATSSAITAARNIVCSDDAAVNKNAPVGRLSDLEWGWIISTAIFAWIRTKSEQAAAEELSTERCIRMTGLDRNPWDAGAVAAILPELAKCRGVDWQKPLADWSKENMIDFLLETLRLVRRGMIARDLGDGIARKSTMAHRADTATGEPNDSLDGV